MVHENCESSGFCAIHERKLDGRAGDLYFLQSSHVRLTGTTAGEYALCLHLAPSTLTRSLENLESREVPRRTREGRSAIVEVTAKVEEYQAYRRHDDSAGNRDVHASVDSPAGDIP